MKHLLLPVFILLFNQLVNSQSWSTLGTGVDGDVYAITEFNSQLVIGGTFFNAGGNPAYHIATWDGNTWSTLGSGMNGDVFDLIVFNGELYACGNFIMAGGNTVYRIAKWDGTNWVGVGVGMTGGPVYTMAVYQNHLYIGGGFKTAGGQSIKFTAMWNGTTWTALDTGLAVNSATVTDMLEYQNELYVCGVFDSTSTNPFNNMAKWNGASWSMIPCGGTSYSGDEMVLFNNSLVNGGSFTTAGGISARNIAMYDGITWSALGAGIGAPGSPTDYVSSVAVYNNELYAAGWFATAGGSPANNIAKWDGVSWTPLTTGTDSYNLRLYGASNGLYVGGTFTDAGGLPANYIAKWGLPTNILEKSVDKFKIYPNPAAAITTVKSEIEGSLELVDMLGVNVLSKIILPGNNLVDLSDLNDGVYFYRFKKGNSFTNGKIIVDKQ